MTYNLAYDFENEGFKFNCTGEGVEIESDGREYHFKSWLRISDKKYTDFIDEPIYNSFLDTYRTGLEIAIGKQFEGWNFGKFALNILFCDFVEPQEKGADTYYKIVPKHSGVPDLQLFVEEELKLIADVNSYIPLDTIPYFFKYHFERSENVIEFLRHAIKTTNNVWGMTALSILCKKRFNEWLEHIIKEYGLNRDEIFRQPTTSAPVEEGVNLTYREIATLYYFNGFELTYDNADRIAFYHGQTSRTRGQQLIEKYYTPILKEVESLSNNKYNREIYTNKKSFEAISKIIPLLETEELKLIANEYLKKSENYRK
jgi:hypothetical protein